MVSSDSQTVAISAHLPNGEFRMRGLHAGSYRAAAAVDGIESVGIEVMRHAAGTTDAGDDCHFVRRDTYLRHGFLQRHTYRVVTATWAETNVLVGFKITCLHSLLSFLQQTAVLEFHYIVQIEYPGIASGDRLRTDLYSIHKLLFACID